MALDGTLFLQSLASATACTRRLAIKGLSQIILVTDTGSLAAGSYNLPALKGRLLPLYHILRSVHGIQRRLVRSQSSRTLAKRYVGCIVHGCGHFSLYLRLLSGKNRIIGFIRKRTVLALKNRFTRSVIKLWNRRTDLNKGRSVHGKS